VYPSSMYSSASAWPAAAICRLSSTSWLSIVPSFCCASVLTRAYSAAFVIHGESIPEIRLVVESSAVDIEGAEGKSVCMMSPVFRRTAHLQHRFPVVKGTYVHVCEALRVSVSQRSHIFFGSEFRLDPGAGRADRQNAKTQICKNQNFKNRKIDKSKILKLFSKFVYATSVSK
jgi:hypothetical protein